MKDDSDGGRANAAMLAIEAALENMPQKDLREAGEVALGVHPEYGGVRITHREEEYEDKKQKNRRTFKRRRREAFDYIIAYLQTAPPLAESLADNSGITSPPAPGPDGSDWPREQFAYEVLGPVLSSALNLHYAILSALFVDDLSRRVPQIQNFYKTLPRSVYVAGSKRAYNCYIDFLTAWWYVFKTEKWPYVDGLLTAQSVAAVRQSGQLAFDMVPTMSDVFPEWAEFQAIVTQYVDEAEPLFDGVQISLYASDVPSSDEPDDVPNLYLDIWQGWYQTQLERPGPQNPGVADRDRATQLKQLAIVAIGSFRLIAKDANYGYERVNVARTIALNQLASYFALEDRALLNDGRSLRDHARDYFERMASEV